MKQYEGRGEYRCADLPDASEVCLNTNTVVRYTFNQRTRKVEVVSGEASFKVQSSDSRPFDVQSGGLQVRDLSTSFDVYRRTGSTVMTVIDGRVKVRSGLEFSQAGAEAAWNAAPEYHRLQQVEFDEATGTLHERHTLTDQGLSQLLAWRRGRIDLNGRTLSEALEEFSRYQPIETFNIQDKALRAFKVGGLLESTNLMDFLDALEFRYHIHHTLKSGADGKTVVTLSRQRNSRPPSQIR